MRAALRLLAIIVLLAGALVLAQRAGYVQAPAFGKPPASQAAAPAEEPPPTAVLVAAVELAPAIDQVQAVGSLVANESVTITSEITGRIQELRFHEGQRVDKGAVLVVLDSAEWEAQVRQAEAAVKLQELKYARAAELLEKRTISQQEYDEISAALAEARATLALAKARLAKTVLRAPFSGILGLRQVSPGDYVEAGQAIVNLESIDPMKVDFRAPERYASRLRTGQVISVRVDAYPEARFEGEIYAIDPRLDVASRSILLRARIGNPEGRLLPGMFAQVDITLERREQALWVPEQSLLPQAGRQYVYRVVDDRAVLTPVEIGLRRPGKVEILKGLSPEDVVVLEGHLKLRNGAKVVETELPEPRAKT
jgi:membrane fusion protein (multidrug efflux system)